MQSAIQAADPALRQVVDRKVRVAKIAGGFRFTGGPVFSRIGFLLITDLMNAPNDLVYAIDGSI